MGPVEHLEKTTGRKGESKLSISGNGDVSRAAKVKRIAAKERLVLRSWDEILVEEHRKVREHLKKKWPEGRKLQGRPFPKKPKRVTDPA
jgi:hypothetical protein